MPFNNIATDYFLTTSSFKDMAKTEAKHIAGIYMSVPFLISGLFVPIFGNISLKF
jgi:hypothetical protein